MAHYHRASVELSSPLGNIDLSVGTTDVSSAVCLYIIQWSTSAALPKLLQQVPISLGNTKLCTL